jgi:nucleotide-binding universal stress UspA family protein
MSFEPRRVLVATDFSAHARVAADAAAGIAKAFGGKLTLLHAVPLSTYVDFATHNEAEAFRGVDFHEAILARQKGDADAELARLRAMGLEVDFQSVDGPPAPEIVRIAVEQKYELVVLGTHGRTGIARFLMGSVAEEVVRTCPIPVLSIRTHEEPKAS